MTPRFLTILICFLMTSAQLGVDIYLPSFPAMEIDLATNSTSVQLTFAFFLAAFGFSQIFYGPLADRYGRKPVLVAGVSLFLLMSIACVFAPSIELLILARTLQGVGCGACAVIPRAIMKDTFKGIALKRINLYQSMAWVIIPILAPLIGSYIQTHFGWRYCFVFLTLFSLTAFYLVTHHLKETLTEKDVSLTFSGVLLDYWKISRHGKFWPYLLCAMASVGLLDAFAVASPLLIQEKLGLSVIEYGWSLCVVAVSFVAGLVINKMLLDKVKDLTIILLGVCSALISVLVLSFIVLLDYERLFVLLVAASFAQISIALIFPTCAAGAIDPFPQKAGKAAAIYGCLCMLGATLSSIAISYLPNAFSYLLIVFVANAGVMSLGYMAMKKTGRNNANHLRP